MRKQRNLWLCVGGALVALGTIIVSGVKLADAVVILSKLAKDNKK